MRNILTLIMILLTASLFGQENRIDYSVENTQFSHRLIPVDNDIYWTVGGIPFIEKEKEVYFTEDLSAVVTIVDGRIEIFGYTNDGRVYVYQTSPEGRVQSYFQTMDYSDTQRFPQCLATLEIPVDGYLPILPVEGAEVGSCIKPHFDVGPTIYDAFGQDPNAVIEYLEGAWNVVSLLYAREGVSLVVHSADIYPDGTVYPYEINSTYDGLAVAQSLNQQQGVPPGAGMRHGIGIHPGQGGVAYVGGFNPNLQPVYKCAFSCIYDTYIDDVNTYSWSIMVMAHEMGHSLGLYHTQDCRYDVNGDGISGEAIDGCVGSVGDCDRGPVPQDGGTIMSYCHLNSVGINFVEGFDDQFHNPQMNANAQSWGVACDVSCTGATALTITFTNNSATISWGGSDSSWIVSLEDENGIVLQQTTVETNTYTFTGLTEQTVYTAVVAPSCNPDFRRDIEFATTCNEVTSMPYLTNFDEDTWTQTGDADWVWSPGQYKTSGDEDYGFWQNGILRSPCLSTIGFEYATVEVDLILDLEQDANKSWDWARMEYSKNGTTWTVLGSYESGFYNAADGYIGPGQEGPVWGGSTDGQIVTFTQECSFLTDEPFLIFGIRFFSDSLVWQDGVTVTRFELRGIEECSDSGTVDTVYIDNTDYETIDSLIEVIAMQQETIDSLLAIECPSDTIYINDCDTTNTCENFSVQMPGCYVLYEWGGPTCVTFEDPIITGGTAPIAVSVPQACDPGQYIITATDAKGCEATAIVTVFGINNICSNNPRLGNKVEVCIDGVTQCIPTSQYTSDMQLGACNDNPCEASQRSSLEGKINVYPNPTTGMVNIDYFTGSKMVYHIFTVDSKVVGNGTSYDGSINMSYLPAGSYFLEVKVDGYPNIITNVVLIK